METQSADVVIIGAGLAGLSTALFLSMNGVTPIVIERHASTSVLPKARGQNPVTMEAMRVAGIEDLIRRATPPGVPGITSVESRSMAGEILLDHTVARPDFGRFSPMRPGQASQARTEEALAARVAELGCQVRFNHDCESVQIRPDGATVIARSGTTGELIKIDTRFLVAADGIRGAIPKFVGIDTHGFGLIRTFTAVRFLANLAHLAGDRAAVIHYIQNPELPDGTGVIVSTDFPGEWVANVPAADTERSPEELLAIIKTMIGEPDVDVTILGKATFEYGQWVADRFREGPVLLAGDAAHVMPPTGGQGGNTAVQDGYFLGWKLAAVVRGIAGERLLDSYDVERRPYADAVTVWQAANLAERRVMSDLGSAMGEPMDHATLLFGYVCPDGAYVGARPEEPFEDPRMPSGRPGSRVLHCQLKSADGEFSPRDVLGMQFLLFTCSEVVKTVVEAEAGGLGVPLHAHVVASTEPLGCAEGESVLVRPDGIVGWRGAGSDDAAAALRTILDR